METHMSHIYSVTQLSQEIKNLLESRADFRNIFVQGEISNYKQHTSGHHYMTLKDAGGAISAVLFRADAQRLRFQLANGMKVIARGRVSSFPKTGQVQLYLADLMPDGAGALHLAFEQRKEKLYREGLFDAAHKKPLPSMPETIALVTSPTGAAVHDMLRILARRFPLARVQIWGVLVQGDKAGDSIARAIAAVNAHGQAQVIVVGRGGGSLEDLWAFNEEVVARAIFASKIPVVSAVGHEPDVTISDFVADLRAPTPSGAAELIVPDSAELRLQLDRQMERLDHAVRKQLAETRTRTAVLAERLGRYAPAQYAAEQRRRVELLEMRLTQAMQHRLRECRSQLVRRSEQLTRLRVLDRQSARLSACAGRLQALSPLSVLARGFSVVTDSAGDLVTDSKQLASGDMVKLQLASGSAQAQIRSVTQERKATCQKN
ncbi:MAG: exodeoxyribonuclease VII large subunit [Butyricicoccus pullicaecorum]|nr:exodeoxyribonuclease VII large subunit [Butyricicoccus pullicaecorum]